MKTRKCAPHISAFSAMFVLGNAVISMPLNTFNIYFLILSGIISLALIFIAKLLMNTGKKNKIMFYVISTFVSILALWGAATTFLDFINFLKSEQLPQISVVLLSVVLAGVIIVFVRSNNWAFYKYSLLTAIIGVISIAICFISGIKNFNFQLSGVIFSTSLSSISSFVKFFLPTMLLPFFINTDKESTNTIFFGVAAGFLMLLVCMVQAALTLGGSTDMPYPYLKSISVISLGSLFTRLDGLVYFLFFVTALIKITICLKVIKKFIFSE